MTFKRLRVAGLCALLLIFPALLAAETIILRNGQNLEGRILSQDRQQVVIQTAQGPRVIRKTEIARIVYGRSNAEEEAERKKEEELKRAELARQAEEERRRADEARRLAEEQAARARAEEVARAQAERAAFEAQQAEYQSALASAQQPNSETTQQTEQQEQVVEQAAPEVSEPQGSWGAFWRAAVLPGWGHFYANDSVSGSVYAAAFAAAAYNAYAYTNLANDARQRYQTFSDQAFVLAFAPGNGPASVPYFSFETTRYRENYSRNANRQQTAIGLLGGIYLIQLGHAFFLNGGPWDLLMAADDSVPQEKGYAIQLQAMPAAAGPAQAFNPPPLPSSAALSAARYEADLTVFSPARQVEQAPEEQLGLSLQLYF